jgi:hypothetical protein
MSYKLEHKTISFGIDPVSRLPTQGIEGVFFIPSYQRGYRWTTDEVTKLLDDIWESAGQPYSLQPIVVKNRGDGVWELIDGQQRLTTLWLLLRFMQKGDVRYTLEYETRPGSQAYLCQLDSGQATENIDYFHMHQAHATIANWFVNKMGVHYQQFLIDEMFRFLSTSVRVIWYQAPADTPSIPLFTRLNQGRIPLTDAELIKAVLLTHISHTNEGRETEVAAQWDGIERDLQRDDIWTFIANHSARDAEPHGTRIGLLLDTLAQKPQTGALRYHTFDELREKAENRSQLFWDEVVALHAQILGWFEEPRYYNKIGFLVDCDIPIGDILRLAHGQKKSAFDDALTDHIKAKLNIHANDLDDALRYNKGGHSKLQRLLLLFNVHITRGRFPFEKHVGQAWSLEHIHAQNAQDLTRAEQWGTWLQEHHQALQTILSEDNKVHIQGLIAEIDAAKPHLNTQRFGQMQFNELAARILLALNDGLVQEADHSIANLALLSHGANAALGNAVFEVKRHKVLVMDKAGDYIPTATRNVFLKYYTDAGRLQPHFWGEADKTAYLQEIKQQLDPYLQ